MAVKIRVPGALRQLTRGAAIVEVDANDVSQALDELNQKYPGFRERLYDDKGELRQFINIYRNDEDIRFGSGLKTPLKDSDDLSIVPAVAEANPAMARTLVRLTFRGDSMNDPVIYRMGQEYKVVTNIRRADRSGDSGWVELELDGEQAEVDRALEYCRSKGIEVQLLKPA